MVILGAWVFLMSEVAECDLLLAAMQLKRYEWPLPCHSTPCNPKPRTLFVPCPRTYTLNTEH